HRSGGKGVQVTKKQNDEKDLGEPAFSPDGHFLYFSRDSTPGKHFQYNKDPHAGIYTISRIDLRDGHTEVIAGGLGGAVRPTPSPDGKTLAFVRRVGTKTALFVQDLESGRERKVWDALDRDLQETWAIHGVYPTMAWTPDSADVVLWAGGKLKRVHIADGGHADIPFRVKHTRKIAPAVRYPVKVFS
ncbi:MAG: amidohydrolase, partial [bacterium]|nr:amidohydrolase [bacterium]